MASSVSSQIIQNANYTQQNKAREATVSNSNSTVNSKDFLFLLTQQLQYQDPMNPMDNSQMLAQEAQFATLEQMEALTSSFSKFSNVYQANSLLGQNVEVKIDGKSTSGTVEHVDFSDTDGASISIKGKLYPLDSVVKVYPEDTKVQEENTNFFVAAANSIAQNVYEIAKNFTTKSEDIPDTTIPETPETTKTN